MFLALSKDVLVGASLGGSHITISYCSPSACNFFMYSIASAFMVVTILSTLFNTMFLSAVSSAGRDESTDITDSAPPVGIIKDSLGKFRII